MKLSLIIFSIATILFIAVIIKQFKIISTAGKRDPLIRSKMLLFLFILFYVLTTAILVCAAYFKDKSLLIPASGFYFVSGVIAAWAYYSNHEN